MNRFKFKYNVYGTLFEVYAIDFCEKSVCVWIDKVSLKGMKLSGSQFDLKNLIQCTGLKDKNGKLIYEGDILKAYFENSDTGKTCFEYVPVGYDEEKLAFYTGKKFRALFAEGYFIPEEYEIAGNIYENQELLEV